MHNFIFVPFGKKDMWLTHSTCAGKPYHTCPMVYSSLVFAIAAIVLWRSGCRTNAILSLCVLSTSVAYHTTHGSTARVIDILTVRWLVASLFSPTDRVHRVFSAIILVEGFYRRRYIDQVIIPLPLHIAMHVIGALSLCSSDRNK